MWSDVRDYAKAHPAIVPFINQDPHLAASISPNSNKERWLVGDGKAYINTGIVPTGKTRFEVRYKNDSNAYSSCGSRTAYLVDGFTIHSGVDTQFNNGTQNLQTGFNTGNTMHLLIFDAPNKKAYIDDRSWDISQCYGNKYPLWLFANNNAGAPHNQGAATYEFARIYEDTDQVANFLPCLYNGIAGMVDAISGTFHPNANTQGQFTIAITDKE